jgi:hypothetical protein
VDFFGADTPFPDSNDGVKLGESTLNRFLLSNETVLVSKIHPVSSEDLVSHLSDWFALSFVGS